MLARTAVAAAVMLPIAFSRNAIVPVLRRWKPVVAYAAVEIVMPWFLLARAEVHLSSSLTGLLLAGVPVAGVLIALLLRTGEQLTPRAVWRDRARLVGVALLVGFDVGAFGGGDPDQLRAVVEIAGVVVCYAIGPVIMVRAMPDLPSSGVIAVSLAVAAVAVAVPGVLQAPDAWPSTPVVLSVLGLALVCTALAFQLLFLLVAEVGAVRATLITYLNPAVAVVAGVLVLDERVTWVTLAGFVLVVGGSVLASRRRPVTETVPEPAARSREVGCADPSCENGPVTTTSTAALRIGPHTVVDAGRAGPDGGHHQPGLPRAVPRSSAPGGVYVSEMVTSRALVERTPESMRLIRHDADERPRSVQLYGVDPATVGAAVRMLVEEDRADHVDLNFGCPVPKVTRKGGGAALPWKTATCSPAIVRGRGARREPGRRARSR